MSTQQPIWKLVANLGDVHPINYGGLFVYVDTTGVYPPEAELLEPNDSDGDPTSWETRRFILENLTAESVKTEWFYESLDDVSSYVGESVDTLIAGLLSDKPEARGYAWRSIGEYHGWDNLDSYPPTFTNRDEVEARYEETA